MSVFRHVFPTSVRMTFSVIERIKAAGALPLRQIAGRSNEQNITTVRGGEWGAVQVRVRTSARWYRENQEHLQRLRERALQV